MANVRQRVGVEAGGGGGGTRYLTGLVNVPTSPSVSVQPVSRLLVVIDSCCFSI